MKTKEIQNAIEEFDIISSILNLEDEILHDSLIGKKQIVNNETYYFDNLEEINRYYINEICSISEYNEDVFRNDKILQARVDGLLRTLYSNVISHNLIDILVNAVYHDVSKHE